MSQEQNKTNSWIETVNVTSETLLSAVKGLLNEASVRRIVICKKDGSVLVEIPLYLGLTGLLIFNFWVLMPLVASLLVDYSIHVTREGKAEETKGDSTDVKVEIPATSDEPPAPSPQPPATQSPAPLPDDLTKIKGIGPKVASLLNESSIINFAQLSTIPITELQAILDKAGSRYRIIDPVTWPEQAKQMMSQLPPPEGVA